MKLLVTGGAGFIGSHVVESALVAGYEVAVFDSFCTGLEKNVPKGVRVFLGDMRDRQRVFGAFGAFGPTHVSHHAAWIDAPGSLANPRAHFENNVIGSINVIDASVAVGVGRFVFASSGGAIYGDTGSGFATENSLPCPENPYGAGKLAVEHLLASACRESDMSGVAFRYPNVYGPRSRAGVIGKFVRAALRGNKLSVFGDGEGGTRTYAFVSDVARANVQALSGDSKCAVVNVGAGYATTGYLARLIKELTGSKSEIVNLAPRNGDVVCSRMAANDFVRERACPVTDLIAGLNQTIEWWKNEDQSRVL